VVFAVGATKSRMSVSKLKFPVPRIAFEALKA